MSTNNSPILSTKLSLDSDVPLYNQLVAIIKRHISAGILSPGDLLPSEAELCRALSISRSTCSPTFHFVNSANTCSKYLDISGEFIIINL